MKSRFYGFFVLRAAFILFFLLTSLYCFLAYIPFTYEQVHKALASLALLAGARDDRSGGLV